MTAGVAYGNPANKSYEDTNPNEFTRDIWRAGYAAGAGVEYALAQTMTIKVEGLYYDLGSHNVVARINSDSSLKVTNTQTVVRGSVNFKF